MTQNSKLEQQLIQEIGMHIIDPETHYTMNSAGRKEIKDMLMSKHGIDADESVIDLFVEFETGGYWEISEEYGLIWLDRDPTMQERANDLVDYATDYSHILHLI